MLGPPILLLLLQQPDPNRVMLSIDHAIAIAQTHTNDIVRAKYDLLLVDVERARALGGILPSVNFSIGVGNSFARTPVVEARDPRNLEILNRYEPEGTFSESFFRPTFSMRQLIFDGGRWWLIIARVSDIALQRESSLDAVRNDVRLNVVRQFYNLERARQAVETFRGQIEVSQDQLVRARRLMDEGRGKQSDVVTAQRNLAEDKVQFARREFAYDEARRNLNIALGRDSLLPVKLIIPPEVATATIPIPDVRLPASTALIDRAMKVRPEVIRSRATLEIIRKNIGIREADRWPRLSLGAAYRKGWYGAGNRRFDDVFDTAPNENYFITLDATITWNIFDGLQTEADVEEAEIALRRALSDHENLERLVAREVDSRAQNLALQMAVYDLARDAAQNAHEAVRLARGQFSQGKATALELRDAEQKLTQSKLQATNARLDVEIAIEELRRAVGEPTAFQ